MRTASGREAGSGGSEDHRQRPRRLRSGQDPLGQGDLPVPGDQLRAEPHQQAKQHPGGAAETPGRSPAGTKGPRFRAASGQAARATKPTAAQSVCGSDPPSPAGSGNAATSTVATPPVTRMSRPTPPAAAPAPSPTWQAPTPASASVITHWSAAPSAASELIVPATAFKEPGCSPAATVQPPTSSTGATAEETRPHHGTPRTTTTVGERPASQPSGRAGFRPDGGPGTSGILEVTANARRCWPYRRIHLQRRRARDRSPCSARLA